MSSRLYCHFYHANGFCNQGEWCEFIHGENKKVCPNGKNCPIRVVHIKHSMNENKQKAKKRFTYQTKKQQQENVSTCANSSRRSSSEFSNNSFEISTLAKDTQGFQFHPAFFYSCLANLYHQNAMSYSYWLNQTRLQQQQYQQVCQTQIQDKKKISIRERFLAKNKIVQDIECFVQTNTVPQDQN